jgi:16S rRNA (uracil1498-N3)-methyltransferase
MGSVRWTQFFRFYRGDPFVAERFYCPEASGRNHITLRGDEARHLSRVRRLGPGDVVEVFDGKGFAVRARVTDAGADRVELEPVGDGLPDRTPPCRLTLATAVPKGERLDWLVEKATELGVERLVPIVTERSVVEPRQTKLGRLHRVIIEASKQCGRNKLMELDSPARWTPWATAQPTGLRLLAHPGSAPLAASTKPARGEGVTLAVGPEGGFTELEVEAARAAGWRPVGLGPTLLRVETAALAGAAILLALCEETDR